MASRKLFIARLIFLAGIAGFLYFGLYKVKIKTPAVADNFHYSYFSQPDFFDQAYSLAKSTSTPENIKGIIVNHHLLASSFIAETFNVVATNAPLTVLLVSPNHFDAGRAGIITSSAAWKTPYGELESDLELINQLTTQKIAAIEEPPFEQEHGISGIVAFIKKSLPNAKVIPVIFKNRMPVSEAQKLADDFHQILPKNTLLVGSFDFSHYLTSRAADFHDINSMEAVENFNFSKIKNLDIDSRPGLAFFLRLLKNNSSQNFHLLEHSNSSKLVKQDILETTSYIDGYFTAGLPALSSAETLLSLPSVLPAPETPSLVDKDNRKYALTYMERLFFGQDETVSFFPLSNSMELESERNVLSRLGIGLVAVNYQDYQLGDIKIRLVNCNGDKGGEKVKGADGAAVVICQGSDKNRLEIAENKPVIYAVGNLFSKNSLAIGLGLKNNQLQIFLLPIGFKEGQVKLLIGQESGTVLKEMAAVSAVSQDIKNQIKSGIISIDKNDKN